MLVQTASPCYSGTWYILSLGLAMSRRKLAVCLQVSLAVCLAVCLLILELG